MMREILSVTNSVVGESALPNVQVACKVGLGCMGESAFDQLHGTFERNFLSRGEKEMEMVRHKYEGVDLEFSFSAIFVLRFQEEPRDAFRLEQAPALPGTRSDEVRSRGRDSSCRFHICLSGRFISWLSGTTEVVPFPRNSLREEIALVERFDENLDAPNLAARNFYL